MNAQTVPGSLTLPILRFNNVLSAIAIILCLVFAMPEAVARSDSDFAADLSHLEMKFFRHDSPDEPLDVRLNRLERFVFGSARSGSSEERLTSLLLAVPNLTTNNKTSDTSPAAQESPAKDSYVSESPEPDNSKNNSAATGESEAAAPAIDYYPTVTALEEHLTGRSHKSLPIEERLAKLETRAFGKPSTLSDLSKRVDLLKEFAANQNGQNEDYLSSSAPAIRGNTAGNSGILSQVDLMERFLFGKTYSRDGLDSRLNRMEKNLFPGKPLHKFSTVGARIDRLRAVLWPVQPGSTVSAASDQNGKNEPSYDDKDADRKGRSSLEPDRFDRTSQDNNAGGIQPFTNLPGNGDSAPAAQNSSGGDIQPFTNLPGSGESPPVAQNSGGGDIQPFTNLPATSNKQEPAPNYPKPHPFLHKLGTVIGDIGGLAAGALGSMSTMSMYGGYPGYGGYGMYPGYGGYGGYSGYGGYGYGGMGGLGNYGYGGLGNYGYGGLGNYGYSGYGSTPYAFGAPVTGLGFSSFGLGF